MKIFAFCLLAFAFFLVSCRPAAAPVSVSNRPISINNVPQTNLPMPPSKPLGEMTWTSFEGATEKLGALKGKAVVLDYWATYCAPCIKAIPHLVELQNKYGKDNLQVVGLHVGGDEDRPKVAAFVEKLKINYTLATPEDALSEFVFRDRTDIPQTVVLDRNGSLVQRFIGFDDTIKAELDRTIEQAVNGQ